MAEKDPAAAAAPAAAVPEAQAAELNEFEALLNKEFRPKTSQAQEAIQSAVRTLAEQALHGAQLISADVLRTVEAMIAEIDRKLSEQINLIMHHEDFKTLEGAWRGLNHLVTNTETDAFRRRKLVERSVPIREWLGIKARFSKRSMKKSSVHRAVSLMAS